MRILIQRVSEASVTIDGNVKSAIQNGLLVLVGIENEDDQTDIEWLTKKVLNLRIFNDENEVMNLSVKDIDGEILVITSLMGGNEDPTVVTTSKTYKVLPLEPPVLLIRNCIFALASFTVA